MAMDYSWLPPGVQVKNLPAGMRNHNPGNIKYFKGLGYPGMLGPSVNTDQGDPQMTFDTPQSGMNAAATLAWKKYQGGKRTPRQIIADQRGWTPGNVAAANNIATTLGISLDDDLNLSDKAKMAAFLRALTKQEHGNASGLYANDLYDTAAASAVNGQPMPAQRYVGGTAAAPSPAMPAPQSALAAALMPPDPRDQKMADLYLSQAATAKPTGWGTLLQALGNMATGQGYAQRAAEGEKTYRSKLAEALTGAKDTDALTTTLLGSGDPSLQNAGVQMKVAKLKPQSQIGRFRPTKQGVVDTTTGQIVPGTEAQAGADAEFGTSINRYRDKDGKVHVYQASKAGGRKDIEFPEGAVPLDPLQFVDTGTGTAPVSKYTAEPAAPAIVKDIAGEAKQKEVGKTQGERQMAQPATKASMRSSIAGLNSLIKAADALKVKPGLEAATGSWQGSGYIPTVRQETADAEADLETLKSKVAFNVLQAMRDASKTGGALGSIAVEELKMLQNNLASLDLRQGTPQFKANLDAIAQYAVDAQKRLLQGYRDTYGADFTDEGPAPAAPDPVNAIKQKYGLE